MGLGGGGGARIVRSASCTSQMAWEALLLKSCMAWCNAAINDHDSASIVKQCPAEMQIHSCGRHTVVQRAS